MTKENLVTGAIARRELGKPGPPIGATRYSAILNRMGKSGARFVLVSEIRAWMIANPNFKEREVYPRRSPARIAAGPPVASARMNGGSLLRHDQRTA